MNTLTTCAAIERLLARCDCDLLLEPTLSLPIRVRATDNIERQGKLLVVIAPPNSEPLVAGYALRWGIETLFGIFKTRGFCLEAFHFTEQERLRKRVALLTLALCCS